MSLLVVLCKCTTPVEGACDSVFFTDDNTVEVMMGSARVRSKAAENDSQAEAAPDKPAATDSDQSPKKPKLSKNSAPSKAEPAKKKKTPAKKGSLKKVKILLRALGFVICWMARNEQSFC